MASKLTQWINSELNKHKKKYGASPEGIKKAKEDGKAYSSIAAAKKAGALYYKDPKSNKMKIAAYAEDLKGFVADKDREVKREVLPEIKPKFSAKDAGKGPNVTVVIASPKKEETPEKRDASKRMQALKGVSNAKLASRIRGKLADPSFKKSNRLSSLKERLKNIMKINASTKDGERAQKMQLDVLLRRVDEMIMNKGGVVKKKKKMNMGGIMDDKKINPTTGMSMSMGGLSGRKVNPSTGLSMKKGGMIDYRKTGMMYGGGMARKR